MPLQRKTIGAEVSDGVSDDEDGYDIIGRLNCSDNCNHSVDRNASANFNDCNDIDNAAATALASLNAAVASVRTTTAAASVTPTAPTTTTTLPPFSSSTPANMVKVAGITSDGITDVGKKYKRQKAKRACLACQRAHLTCGDERPCSRCVKRGMDGQCQDGIRKKAKYLHDAPLLPLGPGLGYSSNSSNSNPANNPQPARPDMSRHPSNASDTLPLSAGSGGGRGFFTSPPQASFPGYPGGPGPVTLGLPDAMMYSSQPSPVSPGFLHHHAQIGPSGPGQHGSTSAGLPTQLHDVGGGSGDINFSMLEPTNPAGIFNFDLKPSGDFTSHYGLMEWEILGHMSSGAAETPSSAQTPGADGSVYGDMFGAASASLSQFGSMFAGSNALDMMGMEYGGGSNNSINTSTTMNNNTINTTASNHYTINGSNVYANGNLQHGLPHAFAIATGPANLASPSSSEYTASPQAMTLNDSVSPVMTPFGGGGISAGPPPPPPPPPQQQQQQPAGVSNQIRSRQQRRASGVAKASGRGGGGGPNTGILGKKKRDSSWIYTTVLEPYSYLTGFHNLVAYLQKRFSPSKTVHIAKYLASIRPSFISCMQSLTRDDLVMMERVFQRTLVEFETFLDQNSSPAIVCRRTGEVVAVNNQFVALTGWTKDVLLGNEPNLNVNTGGGVSDVATEVCDGTQQQRRPVFVAELLDDETVVKFYEDFALLAFEDSRGVRQRKGQLLKYRAGEAAQVQVQQQTLTSTSTPTTTTTTTTTSTTTPRNGILSSRVTRIDGEHGISRFEKNGKVECTYCWYIKRDPFDMPMMIVMNFLPCYDTDRRKMPV